MHKNPQAQNRGERVGEGKVQTGANGEKLFNSIPIDKKRRQEKRKKNLSGGKKSSGNAKAESRL